MKYLTIRNTPWTSSALLAISLLVSSLAFSALFSVTSSTTVSALDDISVAPPEEWEGVGQNLSSEILYFHYQVNAWVGTTQKTAPGVFLNTNQCSETNSYRRIYYSQTNVPIYVHNVGGDVFMYTQDGSDIKGFGQYYCGSNAFTPIAVDNPPMQELGQIYGPELTGKIGAHLMPLTASGSFPIYLNASQNIHEYVNVNPPTGGGIEFPAEVTFPQFKACVDYRNLTITDKSNPLQNEVYIRYYITQGTFETGVQIQEFDLQHHESKTIKLSSDQPFNVQAVYFSGGYIKEDDGFYDYQERSLTFSKTGTNCQDTTDGPTVCDETGLCTTPIKERYPDCTEHNWVVDLWGIPEMSIPSPMTVGCAVGVFWSMVFDFIFDTSNDELQNPFGEFTTETYGLTAIITAPLQVFSNLSSNSYTCDPITLPFAHIGNMQLPCMTDFYQNTLGAFFTMYQTIISGIISYYVLINMLRMAKEAKDPQNDRIEVTDL